MFLRLTEWLIVFSLLAFSFTGEGPNDHIVNLLQVASFIFGILIAFYTVSSHNRFNSIAEALQQENGSLLSIYHMSEMFGKKTVNRIRKLVDAYYVDSIDYYLTDYNMTKETFMKLFRYVFDIKPKTEAETDVFQSMIDCLTENIKNRKRVESLVKARMSVFEWIILVALMAVMVFCLFYLNDGSIVSILITILLSTISVVMLYILYDLESLKWQYEGRIWNPLQDTFREFDLMPYYPRNVILEGMLNQAKGEIRVAFYPSKYPEMGDKKVEIIDVEKDNVVEVVRNLREKYE